MTPPKRTRYKPELKMQFWKIEGKKCTASKEDLLEQISKSGRTEAEIRKRMGHGDYHLDDALAGKSLDLNSAKHIEWGIIHEDELHQGPPHSYPWRDQSGWQRNPK